MSTTTVSEKFKVKDLSLADWGRKEIILAQNEMPGLSWPCAKNMELPNL